MIEPAQTQSTETFKELPEEIGTSWPDLRLSSYACQLS
jgi:hypothetical protein